MNPLHRRVAGCVIAVGVAVALSACGSSSDKDGDASKGATGGGDLVIGVIGSQTGPAAYLGTGQKRAIDLAVAQLNASGGVLGRKLSVTYRDDGGTPEQAVAQARSLVSKSDIPVIMGASTTATSQGVEPIIMAAKRIYFPGSAVPSLIDAHKYPYAFRGYETSELDVEAGIKYLQTQHYSKIAIFSSNDTYGATELAAFTPALKSAGLNVVVKEKYNTGQSDFTPLASKAKSAGADVTMLLSAVPADQANIAKALIAAGASPSIISFATVLSKQFKDLAGSAGNKVVGVMYKSLTYEASGTAPQQTLDWLNDLKKSGDISGDLLIVDAYWYDMVKVWADAVKRAGSTEPDEVKAALEQTSKFNGISGSITFTPDSHEGLSVDALTAAIATSLRADGLYQAATS